MPYKILIFILCVFLFGSLMLFITNYAIAGPPTRDDYSKPVVLTNPLGDQNLTPNALIGQLINGVLGIVGSLALVMFIYGGFTWMLAAGDSGKVQKGKDILIWATIGLVVIFSAYAMVKFVLTGITGV